MKRLFAFVLWFWPLTLFAANWYVRPAATGGKTGSDWDNAWALGSIGWSKVGPGDTVWLAGGSYGGLTTGASGSADKPILIRRVLSSDPEATGAPGWNSSFDSQVQLGSINVPSQSWVTIDGRQKSGILVTVGGSGGNGMSGATSGNIDHITVRFVEFVGPNKTSGLSYGRYGINLAPSNNKVTNLTIQDCWLHTWCEALRACNWDTVMIERCIISDTSTDNIDHSDVIYSYPSKNVTFRNNSIFKSPEDGMFHEFGGAVNFKFYGNIFWDTNWHMICFKPPGTYGPVFFYNNVFSGRSGSYGYITKSSSTIASGSLIRNNVFLNTTNDFGAISDYNYYVPATVNGYGAPKEPHSIIGSVNPFVNSAAGDFHLTKAGADLLANKGQDMGAEYSLDADGTTRGAGGGWDIGAYETGGTSVTPTPTATPTATPSPTVAPTATPTATPTPPPTVLPSPKFKTGDWVKATDNINVRGTPAGTLMGSQSTGATGQVVDGPQIRSLNGTSVTWWGLAMSNAPSGWVGEDYLAPSAAPTASPSPSPSSTPDVSFHSWLGKVNTKISTDKPSEQQLNDWIKNNPAKAD